MAYCSGCGHQAPVSGSFCPNCGQAVGGAQSPSECRRNVAALRTTTMVLGLIAATLLLITGCVGAFVGTLGEGVEEAFDTELSSGEGSTPSEVSSAGSGAMVVAVLLFVGAGLARVATKTSLVLLLVTLASIIGVAATDPWSIFAFVYWLAVLVVGIAVVLMALAYWRGRSSAG